MTPPRFEHADFCQGYITAGCEACRVEAGVRSPGVGYLRASKPKGESYGRRVTKAKNGAIARGINPGSGLELLQGTDKTCGHCWHAISVSGRKGKFWKCELGRLSNSATTDIRLSWPACKAFSATNDGKSVAPRPVYRASLRHKSGQGQYE